MEPAILYLETTPEEFKEKVKNLFSQNKMIVKECEVPNKLANPLDPLTTAIVLVLPGMPRHYGIIIKYLVELCTEVGIDFKKVLKKQVTILINAEEDFDKLKSVLIERIKKTDNNLLNFEMDNIHKWTDRVNDLNEEAEKAIRELAKVSESITGEKLMFSKHVMFSKQLGEHVFKSGINIGKSMCIFLTFFCGCLLFFLLWFACNYDWPKSVVIGGIKKTDNNTLNFEVDKVYKWSDRKNELNEKVEKAIQELAKVNESIKTLSIIAVGNPAVGKSLFLNILLGEHVFKSGINIGKGLTNQLDKHTNASSGVTFLDTPGLNNEGRREVAGRAISKGLSNGGAFKVLFFVSERNGRVDPQDATTMKVVLDSAPEIWRTQQGPPKYGVIVNQVEANVMEALEEETKRFEFLHTMFAGINEEQRCVYDMVAFFNTNHKLKTSRRNPEVVLPSPGDLEDLNGSNLRDFVYKTVPSVELSPSELKEIQTYQFEQLLEKQEESAKKLEEMTEQQRMERREFERKRNEDAQQIQQMSEQQKRDREEFERKIQQLQLWYNSRRSTLF